MSAEALTPDFVVAASPAVDAAELLVLPLAAADDPLLEASGLAEGVRARVVAEVERRRFRGKLGSRVLVGGEGELRWVLVVGTGEGPATRWRRVGSAAWKAACELEVGSVQVAGTHGADAVAALVEGIGLSAWRFDRHKSAPEEPELRPERVVLAEGEGVADAVSAASDAIAGVVLARNVANESPNHMRPADLAAIAEEVASRLGLEAKIFDEAGIREKGFRLLEAVGRGSKAESRMIHLIYRPAGEVKRRVALVGKGITFDSGGYSIKPSPSQVNMHLDMGGAAAVIGAAEAIGRLKPAGVEVHFIVPAAENLISGDAYLVMDVIRAYNGVSVEIHNTDAEGRLALADALAYAAELEPDAIVDLATLTGSCVVALGMETAGLFSPDDALATELLSAADAADEALWRMPLVERIEKQIDSDRADIKNVGSRWGGAISAALFLKRFVGERRWAHIDIAGPAMADDEWEYINRGGTGYGVLLLRELVRSEEA